jgi:predicted O-methyltransferase YrrM
MATQYEFKDDWFSMRIPVFQERVGPFNGQHCRLLEIGAYEGRATTWLIDNALGHPDSRLDTIDRHPQPVLPLNIERSGRAHQVTLHAESSQQVLRRLPVGAFDFIYIDGSHATCDVLEDAVAAFQLAKLGGLIALDDYLWDEPPWNKHGTPKAAIDALVDIYARPTRYPPKVAVIEIGWQVWLRKIVD